MKEFRKKVWIHEFQTRMFIRVCAYGLICLVTLWNLLFVWRLLQEGPGDLIDQYGRFMKDYYAALLLFLLLLPFAAWDAVKFCHKIVGPLVRIRHAMRQLAAGETVQFIRLREGDYLIELKDDFNAMLDALQRRGVPVMKPIDPAEEDAQRKAPEIASSPDRGGEAMFAALPLPERGPPLGEAIESTCATDGFLCRRQGRRGATTMEYLVMLSFILLVVIVGVQSFGSSVARLFQTSANATSQTPAP